MKKNYSIIILLALSFLNFSCFVVMCSAGVVDLGSPDGKVVFAVDVDNANHLVYQIKFNGKSVISESKLGIRVDSVRLGDGVEIGKVKSYRIKESYPWRGVKPVLGNNCKGALIDIKHGKSSTVWQLDVRCYDDGVAFRYLVAGKGERKVTSETCDFRLPLDAVVWYTEHLEGVWDKFSRVDQLKMNLHMQLPVTAELVGNGYAVISEADNLGYTSSTVNAREQGRLQLQMHGAVPFDGDIATPWRVIMLANTLNEMVNSDIIAAVCPAPDEKLFPDGMNTDWIKTGRCLWQWWAYHKPGVQWEKQRWFIDMADELGCVYYLVDEGWQNPKYGWITDEKDEYEHLKELCDYAGTKGVGVFVWASKPREEKRFWPGTETREKANEFLSKVAKAGAKGVKMDFIHGDDHEYMQWYKNILKVSAELKLMVSFHGCTKPTGEARTFPNEINREDVYGLEQYKAGRLVPGAHFTALPFTRYAVGHGDFTPTVLNPKKVMNTTFALQTAAAIIYTSPMLCWADQPEYYIESVITDLIRTMPATWDETVVLPQSKIGTLAAFARRKGDTWFIGAINGIDEVKSLEIPLSFLGEGRYFGTLIEDKLQGDDPGFVRKDGVSFTKRDTVRVSMKGDGGFVGRLSKLAVESGAGPFTGELFVKLRAIDKKSRITYTLDGTEPTGRSTKYKQPIKLTVSTQIRLKAFGGAADGAELKTWFVKVGPKAPLISPNSEILETETAKVIMSTDAINNEIRYTVDGSVPTAKSMLYKGPFTVRAGAIVKAVTVAGDEVSKIAERGFYALNETPPMPDVQMNLLQAQKATTGWGDIVMNKSLEGNPLTINEKVYDNGIGTHANSEMVYALDASYRRFVASVGLDDETGRNGSIQFKVEIDGKTLSQSPVLKPRDIWNFNVEIAKGSKKINLIVDDAGDGNGFDHADWVNCGFVK